MFLIYSLDMKLLKDLSVVQSCTHYRGHLLAMSIVQ